MAFHRHGSDRHQYALHSAASAWELAAWPQSKPDDFRLARLPRTSRLDGAAAEADTVQLIGLLKHRYKLGKVFFVGGSMGGASVLTFAALHPELVDGVSSQNGVANLLEYNVDILCVVTLQTAIKDAFGGRSDGAPKQYKKRNPQAYRSRRAEFHPEKFTMPLAVTIGDKDGVTPPQSVLRLAAAVKRHNPNVLVIERPDGGHETNRADTVRALEFVIAAAHAIRH